MPYLPLLLEGICPCLQTQMSTKLTSPASETTATALTFLFYHLARDPIHIQIIRNELQSVEDIRSNDGLHALPYLNACITETLRLHPPTPSGLMRQTPAEGIYIGDTYIPGHVTCVAPTYSIARRESRPFPSLIQYLHTYSCKVLTLGIRSRKLLRKGQRLPARTVD